MLSGLSVTGYYMIVNQPWLRSVFGVDQPVDLWWGIQPISAGLFGVPVGFAVMIVVSWVRPAKDPSVSGMVDDWRYP